MTDTWKPQTTRTFCNECGTERSFTEDKCDYCATPQRTLAVRAQAAADTILSDPEYIEWSKAGLVQLAYLEGYAAGHKDALRKATAIMGEAF